MSETKQASNGLTAEEARARDEAMKRWVAERTPGERSDVPFVWEDGPKGEALPPPGLEGRTLGAWLEVLEALPVWVQAINDLTEVLARELPPDLRERIEAGAGRDEWCAAFLPQEGVEQEVLRRLDFDPRALHAVMLRVNRP